MKKEKRLCNLRTVLLGLVCIVAAACGIGCDKSIDIGTNNGCDCGCSEWDPDCEISDSVVRCNHDGLNVFVHSGMVCVRDGSASSCISDTTSHRRACEALNRVWDDQSKSCGACMTNFFSNKADQSCHFLPFPLSFVGPGEFFQAGSMQATIDQAEGSALESVLELSTKKTLENATYGVYLESNSFLLGGVLNRYEAKDYEVTNPKTGSLSYIHSMPRGGVYFTDLDGDGLTDMVRTFHVLTNGQRGLTNELCDWDSVCRSSDKNEKNALCNRHMIFWNTGNASQPNFSEEWDYLDSFLSKTSLNRVPLRQCAGWTLLPVDLDGDGRSEIVATTHGYLACSGHKIVVLKNFGGTPRQPSFQALEDIFEAGSFAFFAGDHCIGNRPDPFTNGEWRAGDFDDDGDIDLVFSQWFPSKPLYWMRNIGNATHPFFRADHANDNPPLPPRLPARQGLVDLATILESYTHSGFVDVDGDGLVDILVGLQTTGSAKLDDPQYAMAMYHNVGGWAFEYKAPGEDFHFLQGRLNYRRGRHRIYVADGLTGPGSTHIARDFYMSSSEETHPLQLLFSVYFRTEGRSRASQFAMMSSNPFLDFELLADEYALYPLECPFLSCDRRSQFESLAFVDIDGDGDLDAFLTSSSAKAGYSGTKQGYISFFPNIGTVKKPYFAAAKSSCYKDKNNCPDFLKKMYNNSAIPKKDFSNIAFGDVDGDGDLDAVHGERTIYLALNQGNKTHPDFSVGTQLFPILPDSWASIRTIQLVDLDQDGDLDLVITDASTQEAATDFFFAQNDGLGNFTMLGKNDTANPLRNVKLGANAVMVSQSKFKFFDIDRDGDFDLVSLPDSGYFQVWRNDGRDALDQALQFTRLLPSENPLSHVTVGTKGTFDIIDLDNDGDLEIHAFGSRGPVMASDTASICAHGCLGRGACIQDIGQGAVGDCICNDWFDGRWCERCSETRYGDQCSQVCPDYSKTSFKDGQLATGGSFPILSDCICNPSFVKVQTSKGEDDNDGDDVFQCSCPQGFGFNELINACEQCSLGSFKSDVGLQACTRCDTALGENRATTAKEGATNIDDCFCIDPFVLDLNLGLCSCPASFVLDKATNGSACICEQGLVLSQDGLACEQPNTIIMLGTVGGGAALLVAATFLLFINRKHMPFVMPVRLPFGAKYYFFLSYKQSSGHTYADRMYEILMARGLNTWMDKYQKLVNYNEMIAGVKASAVYVLLLSEGTLESPAVLVELLTAVKLNKPIVLCHVPEYPFANVLAKIHDPKVREIVTRLTQAINSIPAPCYLEPNKRQASTFIKVICNSYRTKSQWSYESISKALAENAILELQDELEKVSQGKPDLKMVTVRVAGPSL